MTHRNSTNATYIKKPPTFSYGVGAFLRAAYRPGHPEPGDGMSDADALAGVPLPAMVREHAQKHLGRIERAEDLYTVNLALERASGLQVMRAQNPADLEALYVAFDNASTARRKALTP